MIAHRIHTITHADKILVIERGRVEEEGRHANLLRRGGRYAKFFQLQFAGQSPEEDAATPASWRFAIDRRHDHLGTAAAKTGHAQELAAGAGHACHAV